MLNIGQDQFDTILQRDESAFVVTILSRVRELQPGNRLPDDMMSHDIRTGIGRARAHDLRSDRLVSEYVMIMFEIAPNFDRQPRIAEVLARRDLTPEDRWESLFGEDMDDAWADADRAGFYDERFWWPDGHDFADDAPDPDALEDRDWGELTAVLRRNRENPRTSAITEPAPDEIDRATALFRTARNG